MISFYVCLAFFNPLSAKLTKRPNKLKQFVGNLPTNCLSVFGHFVGLALKGLIHLNPRNIRNEIWRRSIREGGNKAATRRWYCSRISNRNITFYINRSSVKNEITNPKINSFEWSMKDNVLNTHLGRNLRKKQWASTWNKSKIRMFLISNISETCHCVSKKLWRVSFTKLIPW